MQKNQINSTPSRVIKASLIGVASALFALPLQAAEQYSDTARVISSVAQTDRVNFPRQECRTEYQQQSYNSNNSITGALIGGIAGGLLGNTIGKGNGRVAAAAVGAGVGALAGSSLAANQNSATRTVPVQSCYQVDNWQTVNSGYLVSYEYHGRTYSTLMNSQPGTYIDVNVLIEPITHYTPRTSHLAPLGHPQQHARRAWFNNDERSWAAHAAHRYD